MNSFHVQIHKLSLCESYEETSHFSKKHFNPLDTNAMGFKEHVRQWINPLNAVVDYIRVNSKEMSYSDYLLVQIFQERVSLWLSERTYYENSRDEYVQKAAFDLAFNADSARLKIFKEIPGMPAPSDLSETFKDLRKIISESELHDHYPLLSVQLIMNKLAKYLDVVDMGSLLLVSTRCNTIATRAIIKLARKGVLSLKAVPGLISSKKVADFAVSNQVRKLNVSGLTLFCKHMR